MSGTFIGNSTSIQVLFPNMENLKSQLCRSTDRKMRKGSLLIRKVQFFLTLFKKPLTPPLSFEHLRGEFI